MMRAVLSCVLALLLLAPAPASTKTLTVGDMRRACASMADESQSRCAAFFRGETERSQVPTFAVTAPACRARAFQPDDVTLDSQSFLNLKYWPAPPTAQSRLRVLGVQGVQPCLNAQGVWTNAQLRDVCRDDLAGMCRYFIAGVLLRAGVQSRISNTQLYCFDRAAAAKQGWVTDEFLLLDSAYSTVPDALSRWMRVHPGHAREPAARGLIDALAAIYPCAEPLQNVLPPGTIIGFTAVTAIGPPEPANNQVRPEDFALPSIPPAASTAAPDSPAPGR